MQYAFKASSHDVNQREGDPSWCSHDIHDEDHDEAGKHE